MKILYFLFACIGLIAVFTTLQLASPTKQGLGPLPADEPAPPSPQSQPHRVEDPVPDPHHEPVAALKETPPKSPQKELTDEESEQKKLLKQLEALKEEFEELTEAFEVLAPDDPNKQAIQQEISEVIGLMHQYMKRTGTTEIRVSSGWSVEVGEHGFGYGKD